MKRTTKLILASGLAVIVVGGGATTIAVAQRDDGGASSEQLLAAGEAAREAVGGGEAVSVERDDDTAGFDVDVRRADGSVVEVELSPANEVLRTEEDGVDDDDGDDVAPAGADLRRAADVAVAAAGGTVTDVEWDDGGYDVEIRLDDRRELDVRVDAEFAVVGTTEDRD